MIDIFTGTGAPLTEQGWAKAIAGLGVPDASLWSVLAVETRGFGYLPDRRPKILFERHIFHARTGGRFSGSYPDISNPNPGGYEGGAAEYGRLKRAMVLDRQSALESASWGLGQVMGFNAQSLGYAGVDAMIEAFKGSEDAQLAGCVTFVTTRKALQAAFQAKDWPRVAFFYNGQNYAVNEYDKRLASACSAYSTDPNAMPQISVRAAQARLSYLGFNPKGIDGIIGSGTKAALQAFQASYKPSLPAEALTPTGELDDATAAALRREAGV